MASDSSTGYGSGKVARLMPHFPLVTTEIQWKSGAVTRFSGLSKVETKRRIKNYLDDMLLIDSITIK